MTMESSKNQHCLFQDDLDVIDEKTIMNVCNHDKAPDIQQETKTDSGFAWVVCFASFSAHSFCCGLLYSMGMLFILMKDSFNAENSLISLIGAINLGIGFASAPLVGYLFPKVDGRVLGISGGLLCSLGLVLASISTDLYQLHLTYGLMSGVGISLITVPGLFLLPIYFDQKLSLASGIVSAGCGLGSIVFPYIIKYLADNYGWRGAFLIIAGIQLHLVPLGALYRPKLKKNSSNLPNEYDTEPLRLKATKTCSERTFEDRPKKIHEEKNFFSVLQTRSFLVFCLSQFFMSISVSIIYTYIGDFAKTQGYTLTDAANLYLIIGISTTIMRPSAGLVIQIIPTCPILLFGMAHIILGIITMMFSFFTKLPVLAMYGVLYGIFTAPYNSYNLIILKDMVDASMIPSAVGILFLFLAPGSLFGPSVAGILVDYTKMPVMSFYLAGSLMVLSGLLVLPLSSKIKCNTSYFAERKDDIK